MLVVGLGLVGQILMLFARHQRVEKILGADPSEASFVCGHNRHASWSPDGAKLAVEMHGCYLNGQPVEGGIFVWVLLIWVRGFRS